MQVEELVNQTIQNILSERSDLFIVKLSISSGLDINLTIDGDELVNISDCIDVSRKIEQALDREQYDFSIKVQSPGADEPLQLPRQYKKHVGRKLDLKTSNGEYEAKLDEVSDNEIKISWKTREKKPNGKGKRTINHEITVPFQTIEQAKIKITFNKN